MGKKEEQNNFWHGKCEVRNKMDVEETKRTTDQGGKVEMIGTSELYGGRDCQSHKGDEASRRE